MTGKTILLVDDDFEDRQIIDMAFRDIARSHEVQYAENGEKALEYLHAQPADQLPKLIVLDLNMPRLNGTETLRAIKQSEALRHIPVIIFSTSVNDREQMECQKLGASNYVIKPIRHSECIDVVRYFFHITDEVVYHK